MNEHDFPKSTAQDFDFVTEEILDRMSMGGTRFCAGDFNQEQLIVHIQTFFFVFFSIYPFAVQQKLIQHYKSTQLHLKKKRLHKTKVTRFQTIKKMNS